MAEAFPKKKAEEVKTNVRSISEGMWNMSQSMLVQFQDPLWVGSNI
jgi:hypothetical protein